MGSYGLLVVELIGALVVGILAGFGIARRRYRRNLAPANAPAIPAKLSPEQFQADRAFNIDMYKTGMQQFDKLVTWVAGGGLVVSVPLLREIKTLGGWPFALAIGWLLLLIALACMVAGHFMSTRIYSEERAALDKVHHADATGEIVQQGAKHHRNAIRSGTATKVLNYVSLVAVLGGLVMLGLFAVSLIP